MITQKEIENIFILETINSPTLTQHVHHLLPKSFTADIQENAAENRKVLCSSLFKSHKP